MEYKGGYNEAQMHFGHGINSLLGDMATQISLVEWII